MTTNPGPGCRVILLHDPASSDPVSVIGVILDPDDSAEQHLRELMMEDLFEPNDEDDADAVAFRAQTWQLYNEMHPVPPANLDLTTLEDFYRRRTDCWFELVNAIWLQH